MQIVDPARYVGWDSTLLENRDRSFSHSSAWAKVFIEGYGYRPVCIASILGGRLDFLIPIKEVASPRTGQRCVSFPYSDEYAVISTNRKTLPENVGEAIIHRKKAGWRSIEWRQADFCPDNPPLTETDITHDIDLRRSEPELFAPLKASNRRCIPKAIKKRLLVRIGAAQDYMESFFRLSCLTRKRHGLPPQPRIFIKNVYGYVISRGLGIIVSAWYAGGVVAAAAIFHFGNRALFKYEASMAACQGLKPNSLVLWEALKRLMDRGYAEPNRGRTPSKDLGFLRSMRSWGSAGRPLAYVKMSITKGSYIRAKKTRPKRYFQAAFSRMPFVLRRVIGQVRYEYLGG